MPKEKEKPLYLPKNANKGDLITHFKAYQRRGREDWGLAWYQAAELADRLYTSHGVQPRSLSHDGLGYYGIGLHQLPCACMGGREKMYGRFTMMGNWQRWNAQGGPGDMQCACEEGLGGISLTISMFDCLEYFGLDGLSPDTTHLHLTCRHMINGPAFCFLFRLAAMFCMRHGLGSNKGVSNEQWALRRLASEHDPEYREGSEVNYFLFYGRHQFLLRDDGNILLPGPVGEHYGLWESYLMGFSAESILDSVERAVNTGKWIL